MGSDNIYLYGRRNIYISDNISEAIIYFNISEGNNYICLILKYISFELYNFYINSQTVLMIYINFSPLGLKNTKTGSDSTDKNR